MIPIIKYLISSLLLVGCFCLRAQTTKDLQIAATLVAAPSEKVVASPSVTSATNEVTGTLQILYLGYKAFLSSQDGGRCSFHPSCSTYGLRSIKKWGPFLGAFAAFDRISRCNGQDTHVYSVHEKTGLLLDEP